LWQPCQCGEVVMHALDLWCQQCMGYDHCWGGNDSQGLLSECFGSIQKISHA
jgi:hypothetical protein